MTRRMRVKQSKSQALVGMIGGGIFLFIGLTLVIPTFGIFGIFWTLITLVIAGSNAYNFFSKKGISSWEVDFDSGVADQNNEDFESKLHKLNRLKEDGLITEEEFNRKREEILNQKW